MRAVSIVGDGVTALCCARLLRNKGWEVTLFKRRQQSSVPVVLNSVTIQLISDIFGDADHIFAGTQPINRHYADWDSDLAGQFSASPGLALHGNDLSARLSEVSTRDPQLRVRIGTPPDKFRKAGEWVIYAMNVPDSSNLNSIKSCRYGRRSAILSEVTLLHGVDWTTSWTEATPKGWLFLAPLGNGHALLQAVVPKPSVQTSHTLHHLLDLSQKIKHLIRGVETEAKTIPCAPAKLAEFSGDHWLAIGGLACSYDPICGDGTGYAIRGAILAAAALDATERGTASDTFLDYYKLRTTFAFYTHIRACLSIYSRAGFNRSWNDELSVMKKGLHDLEQELSRTRSIEYGLNGFDLVRRIA